ncbi:triose-phosphate isomerase [Candidatus Parcubacteria bacterium]|nr:triose-phosphate isomerase [Candidatus Parcubacteria bacterium]
MKKRLVVANWKMYIQSPQEAKKFVSTLRRRSRLFSGVEVVIAPTHTLLSTVVLALKGSQIKPGAQDVSIFDSGAHTGYVSASSLKHIGVTHVIISHSERRAQGENDEMFRIELERAAQAGLTPILCIGETERHVDGAHFNVIEKQLSILSGLKSAIDKLVIAYEPVWAIGKTASEAMRPQELTETVIFIRKTLADYIDRKDALKIPILYGGSAEPSNVGDLLKEGQVNGFLVGHASAEFDSFIQILKACKK